MHRSESTMTVDAERRKKLRKRPLSLVYVELPSANGGMMRDLSEEGFAMRAMIPLRAGEQTSFAFSLDELTRIEGEGIVDWIEENGRIAGVKFTQIPATARDQIDEWLLRSDEPSTQEEDVSPGPPVVSTLEELREELRTAPPRPVPSKKEQPSPPKADEAPTAPPQTSEDQLSTPLPESPASVPPRSVPPKKEEPSPPEADEIPTAPPQTSEDQLSAQPPQSPPSIPEEDLPFPLPPVEHVPVSEENTEPAFPPPTEEQQPAPEKTASPVLSTIERKWRMPASSPPVFEPEAPLDESTLPERDPKLPDISSVLIQPAGIPSRHRAGTHPHERWPNLDEQTAASRLPWTEHLTLSSAISIMFVLALTVGMYVFHREVGAGLIWLGEKMGGRPEGVSGASPNIPDSGRPADPPPAPATGGNLPQSGLASGQPAVQEQPVVQEQPAAGSPPPSTADSQPSHPAPGPSPGASASAPEPGQSEYSQAEQLLRANSGVGTTDAVQLLWISVEKGNPNAEIALADLYWQGRGVPKNCDQTRILLAAAARKGNPEARRRLERFQQEGCE